MELIIEHLNNAEPIEVESTEVRTATEVILMDTKGNKFGLLVNVELSESAQKEIEEQVNNKLKEFELPNQEEI